METKSDLPIVEFAEDRAWERWLADNFESRGVWLRIAKKGAPHATVTYAAAVETALCYGWIDGQKAPLNDSFWLQRFTPRGPRSKWSEINRAKAERLIDENRMQPPGLAQVQAAQRDGRWDAAYPSQKTATVPEDFQRELDRHPEAKAFFETLTGVNRYAFLIRLHNVKRPETRAKRIAGYIEALNQRRKLHP